MVFQRSWHRKVVYQSGFRSRAPRQQHLVTPRGTSISTPVRQANVDHAEEFSIVPSGSPPDEFTFTGYFRLASIRTNLRATFGSGHRRLRAGQGSIRNPTAGPKFTSIDLPRRLRGPTISLADAVVTSHRGCLWPMTESHATCGLDALTHRRGHTMFWPRRCRVVRGEQ